MSVEGRNFTWSLAAGEDLSDLSPGTGKLFKAIALDDGMVAPTGKRAGGILLYGGRIGEHITLGYGGVMKFTAGNLVAKGNRLTVTTSGYLVEATSGSYIVGRVLDSAVSSGAVGTGLFNFATIPYMGNSGEIA